MHLREGHYLHNGKYQLLNIIGEGGFSLTYKGLWDTEIHGPLGKIPTQAPVCIKEYFFKDYCLRNEKTNFVEPNSTNGKIIFDKYKEKIIKEARILAELHHPHVVKVLEVFKQNNTVYTVMEFISGDSLKKISEQSGVFSEEKLLPIIYKIGQALQYIHEKNILHLDIKPSNILMDNDDPKLIDFGISKRYDPQYQQETSTTILAASKGYASIEQYDSEGMQVFSPCPDIYSLGATMYFLLTGEVPTESILRSTKGLPSPRELNPGISENTERVILKAMELHANDRYQSVTEMITELGFDGTKDKVELSKRTQVKNNTTPIVPLPSINDEPFDVDDQTQILLEKKSTKKIIWASILFVIATITGVGISYLRNTPEQTNNTGYSNIQAQRDTVPEEIQPKEIKKLPEQADPKSKKDTTSTSVQSDPEKELYESHLDAGKAFLNKKEYSSAKAEFTKAAAYKHSSETDAYIKQCSDEIEKQEINKRKESYELIMNFSTFVVVKKNNLFGMVDMKWNEKAPCVYLGAEPAGKNLVFERTDGYYDIFSSNGEKLQEKADTYNY